MVRKVRVLSLLGFGEGRLVSSTFLECVRGRLETLE
jgi:hypothetical protein